MGAFAAAGRAPESSSRAKAGMHCATSTRQMLDISAWGRAGSRFATIALLAAICCGLGSAQRWWYRRCLAEAESAESARQAQLADWKAQMDRLQQEMLKLPPDVRSSVNEVINLNSGSAG